MSKQLENSKEQANIQIPPTQVNVVETPILQTPLDEERTRKRDRELATPTSGPFE